MSNLISTVVKGGKRKRKFTRQLTVSLFFAAAATNGAATTDSGAGQQNLPRCLYVSSYHKGYAWSDGVEEGVRTELHGKCEILQFDMDTKRLKTDAEKRGAALRAKAIIDEWQPDLVITSDDNAAKYLIAPHYRDSSIPFVFSGINWTVEEYQFESSNITGIVEVAPIKPMLTEAINISGGNRAIYLGADTLTEQKNYTRIARGAKKLNIEIKKILVTDYAQWRKAYQLAQSSDFLVMGSNSGITNWDAQAAQQFVATNTAKLSVTNHEWMMNVTSLGYAKIPQEHGQWAARAALAILDGATPADIPVATNRKWDLWVNDILISAANIQLSTYTSLKAKKIAQLND